MSGVWGNKVKVSIFGESHGPAIGMVLNGLPPGVELRMEEILQEMARRAPGQSEFATKRKEPDQPEILSGVFQGRTTGAPLTIIIRNQDTRSQDYSQLTRLMRPGQVDYTGRVRYQGYQDYRGSGHFSGRITASLVFAGALCKQILSDKGIQIGTHVRSIGTVYDQSLREVEVTLGMLEEWKQATLPVIDKSILPAMEDQIRQAKEESDSIGGTVEGIILGLPAGIGNPFFDSIESQLAHLLFSVPAVKGLEFGAGFDISEMRGSQANDPFYYDGEEIKTASNHNGGIIGGISNGMPVVFRVAIKPPASISKKQMTIDIEEKKNAELIIQGRHDPCIVPRVLPVLEAVTAIGVLDFLL